MDTPILNDKTQVPDEKILSDLLGDTYKYWQIIRKYLNDNYENIEEVWKFYYEKSGWLLQVFQKKRTILWFKVFDGYFSNSFWFGDKAVTIIEESELPDDIKNRLKNSKKYKIGRSVTVFIKDIEEIENVKKLIDIKMNS